MPPRPSRIAALAVALLLAACGPGGGQSPSATSHTSTPSPVPGAASSDVASPGVASPGPAASLPAQADTAWGRIWEGLPNWFPRFAGAEPTEVGAAGPTSATLDIPTSAGSIDEVVSFYRSALEAAGYSVSVDGPLENGGFTISATGPAGCMAQVSVEPLGGSMTVTVLYGAACPFD